MQARRDALRARVEGREQSKTEGEKDTGKKMVARREGAWKSLEKLGESPRCSRFSLTRAAECWPQHTQVDGVGCRRLVENCRILERYHRGTTTI